MFLKNNTSYSFGKMCIVKEKEEVAWQVAEMIIREVLAITMAKGPPRAT